jgi:hypothetical protein
MEEAECVVCGNMQHRPSILPCCHKSVCHTHISEYCPLCKTPVNPEEVISNWLLQALMIEPKAFPCERCENSESFSYCQECRIILCEDCFKEVHIGKYQAHKYSIFTECEFEEYACRTHELPIEYFCTEEWKGMCIGCFEMHEDHPVLNVHEAATQTLFEVKNKRIRLQKTQEQIKYEMDELEITSNEVLRKYADMVEITKDSFAQLRKLLDFKETEICRSIDIIKEKKLSDISLTRASLSKKLARLDNILSMIDISKDLPSSVIMDSMKYLTSLIQNAINIHESTLATFNTTFPYPDFKKLFTSVDTFGYADVPDSPPKLVQQRNSALTPLPSHRRSALSSSSISSRYSSPAPFQLAAAYASLPPTECVLEQRKFVSKLQSSNAIKLGWNHCEGQVNYILEYGIGAKTSGVEQFRQVYQGSSYNCLITDLLPKTTYRFRVCPVDEDKKQGVWSEIASVSTLDLQTLDESTFKNTASIVKRGDEKWIQFERAGIIQATYPYAFGKQSWEVKILSNIFYAGEDSTGWLKIGVSSYKTKQIIGLSHSYSISKSAKANVLLDVDNQVLKVKTSENTEGEVFNLGEGPYLPSFQYKPAKNSRNNVKIMVKFDEKIVG